MTELQRIASHLFWLGTHVMDVSGTGMSVMMYVTRERERILDLFEMVCGARLTVSYIRLGGVYRDLPDAFLLNLADFLRDMPGRIDEYESMLTGSPLWEIRLRNIGVLSREEVINMGLTGPMLRGSGVDWDLRRDMPYGGFENYDFKVAVGSDGDCYSRYLVRMEEMRQSLRILQQCIDQMPAGQYKSDHPLTTPPRKEQTMQEIETLITHFLGVTWGPVIPAGEAMIPVEAPKGSTGYYLVSDGGTSAYRSRIRTPSFPHIQMVPLISKGYTVPDLLSILGAMDFVLADLDR
jgi:NADH-quinone oxidoreductase subunit C/D